MLIIGIDPSLTGTAICALDRDQFTIEKLVTLCPKKGMVGINRLSWIKRSTIQVISSICDNSDKSHEIFIEGFAFGASGRGVFDLGALGGILRLMLAEKFSGYYEVPPTSLKKFICGKGNAKKQIMIEQTYRKYGKGSDVLTDDNQTDAYGLSRMGIAFLQYKNTPDTAKLTQIEIASVKGIGEKQVLVHGASR